MSVAITFEPSGVGGVVATGTYLIDAAKRLGAPLGTGCARGKGECATCLVQVSKGVDLLSVPGSIEETAIGTEQISQGFRLACQVKLEGSGELVVRAVAPKAKPTTPDNRDADLRQEFGQLSLQKKIATLLQLEAITMSEVLNAAIDKPLAFGSRAFDRFVSRPRPPSQSTNPPASQDKK